MIASNADLMAWSGAFWETRRQLGPNRVDTILYQAWSATTGANSDTIAALFMKNVLARARSQGIDRKVRQVFLERGLDPLLLK